MGKKKIMIEKIEDETKRKITFTKRRQGLFKKAADTCVECNSEIAVIAFSQAGNVFTFGHSSVDSVINRYMDGVQVEEEKEERIEHAHKRRKVSDDGGFWWDQIDTDKLNYEKLSNLRNVLMGLKQNVRKRIEELTSSSSFMTAGASSCSDTPTVAAVTSISSSSYMAAEAISSTATAVTSFDNPAASSASTATAFTVTEMEEEDHSLFLTEEDLAFLANEDDFQFTKEKDDFSCSDTPTVAAVTSLSSSSYMAAEAIKCSTAIAASSFDIPAASSASTATTFTVTEMEEEDHPPFLTEEDFSFLANEEDFSFLANEDDFQFTKEKDDFSFLQKEDDFHWSLEDDLPDIGDIFDADEEGQQLASILRDF